MQEPAAGSVLLKGPDLYTCLVVALLDLQGPEVGSAVAHGAGLACLS